MNFSTPSGVSVVFFLIIILAVVAMVIAGVFSASRHSQDRNGKGLLFLIFGAAGWLAVTAIPTLSGILEKYPMPALPFFFVMVNGCGVLFALSSVGRSLALKLPLWWLVVFQSFRLPLELVLHSWAQQGTIPETMTWTGKNLDILSGILALIMAPFANKSRAAAWVSNIVGIVLLLNVARVAILSSPLPFGWDVEPKLLLAFHFPFIWIVSICVTGALAGHLILTRALIISTRSRSP